MKKIPKLIVLTTVVIFIFSFMPAALGKATIRPIEHLTDTNSDVAGWYCPATNLLIFPHGAWLDPEQIDDCIYYGDILERVLKDGRILLKINLHVKGALLLIYMNEPNWFLNPIFIGEIDYYFTATWIVEGNPGDAIPNGYDIWFGGLGEEKLEHITGSGTGFFTEHAAQYGFTPGDSAKVKLNQLGIIKPNLKLEHPKYDGFYLWPAELTFFH